ncbi:MAG: hypothetical protein L0332_11615 [Chloroflexi bacterium]|nr:hypothetical protein [Chloroflexota bacterium]MCI0579635.1 hypothetical protein [Chloroflexota bacterium]MCI0644391.1 hypothetical protein [Chloroflexota bacterium]MCI0727356.1 hypothetical protein [Chloroflexota bacterium]
MQQVYAFLVHNDYPIYFIAGLGLVWYFMRLIQARQILRGAMFGLERERGQQMQQTALGVMAVCLAVIGFVAYVNREIAPTLPPELLRPATPTPNIFITPLSSPTSPQPQTTLTSPLAPTVTLRSPAGPSGSAAEPPPGTPSPAPSPTVPAVAGECNALVQITAPPDGVTVSGAVTFFGTATAENFGAYRLEGSGPHTNGQWQALLDFPGTRPVLDGILGSANFSAWRAGLYAVRLLVLDTAGATVSECGIQLVIE